MITVTADEQMRRVQAILTAFPENAAEVYKKAIRAGHTAVAKEEDAAITQTYAISKANLHDKNVTQRKLKFAADKNVITGEMRYAGYRFPLYRFFATPRTPQRDNGRYSRVHAMINGSWRIIQPSIPIRARQLKGGYGGEWDNAFVAQMKSGHIGVFERKNPHDMVSPIREVMGAAYSEMVNRTAVLDRLENKALNAVIEGADKQIQRILAGR